jgi:hypothetical protein
MLAVLITYISRRVKAISLGLYKEYPSKPVTV